MKCLNCGSSAQVKILSTKYVEDGDKIEVIRYYKCGCGAKFIGASVYYEVDCEVFFEEED